MKNLKKLFSLILVLLLCVNICVMALGAEVARPGIVEGTATFTGSGVIGPSAMMLESSLKKLVIEEGITAIGTYAFSNCANLTEVSLPLSLTQIDGGAFSDCTALKTVRYAGTQAQREELLTIASNLNSYLLNAEWVYGGSSEAELALSITDTAVRVGDSAVVELRLEEACSGLGARLSVSASDAGGSSLALESVTLGGGVGGSVNEDNNGTFVLASGGELDKGAVLAIFSFSTASAAPGGYTVSLSGEMYTGSENSPTTFTVTGGGITVKKPTVKVEWRNYDGTVLDTDAVEVGSVPVYGGQTPVRDSDRLYDYTFSGWDKPLAAVSADTVYTACFSSRARQYRVTIDCGLEGAEYTVKTSGGTAVEANADGSFTLSATETYRCTVDAVGRVETPFVLSIADEDSRWSFDGGSAVLTIDPPELHTGDVNDDGAVDMRDAQALYDYLAGNLVPGGDGIAYESGSVAFNLNVADINGSGAVGADDILPMLELINSAAA